MKLLKQIFTGAAIMVSVSANAQVKFIMNDWQKTKDAAHESGKYIFMDCYTDWCSWCKVMDKETFADDKVAEVLGSKMVCAKMDMEKGVGVQLAMKYGVSAFPSLLVFNSDGRLVYRSMGYEKPEPFLKTIEEALSINEPLAGYSEKIDIAYPDFYKVVFDKTKKSPFPKEAEVYAFMDKQKDLTTEVSWNILKRFSMYDKYNKNVLENIETYRKLYGNADADNMIDNILYSKLKSAIKNKSEEELNLVIDLASKYHSADAGTIRYQYQSTYYLQTGNCAAYTQTISTMLASQDELDAGQLNSYSWNVYEKCDDDQSIKLATSWIEKAVKMDSQYAYLDTYAALLFKGKNYDQAKSIAQKAIETGKKENEDVKETEGLLEKINAAMAK